MSKTATYSLIASYTVPSAATTYTFSSIPTTFTDLIVIANYGTTAAGNSIFMRFNSDTATNYFGTFLDGNGTTAQAWRGPNETSIRVFGSPVSSGTPSTLIGTGIINIQDYANATTFKSVLVRSGYGTGETTLGMGLWKKTPEAINSITFYMAASSILAGTTFKIYGIQAGNA